MNELATKYNPSEVEDKWYSYWMQNDLFKSTPDSREPYTIVIPPPNVTGVLHMGHMLNNTIQDILIRRARMEGKNALWVPGTDHASIATEASIRSFPILQGVTNSLIAVRRSGASPRFKTMWPKCGFTGLLIEWSQSDSSFVSSMPRTSLK